MECRDQVEKATVSSSHSDSTNAPSIGKEKVDKTFLDTDFFFDSKIQYLIAELGAVGPTYYLRVALAILSEGGSLHQKIARSFVRQLGASDEAVESFFALCLEVGLLYEDGKTYRSARADREIQSLVDKRDNWRKRQNRKRDKVETPPTVTQVSRVTLRDSEEEKEKEQEEELEREQEPEARDTQLEHLPPEAVALAERQLEPLTPEIQKSNLWILQGKRPFKKYPNLWISPLRLWEVVQLYEKSGIPRTELHLGFRYVAAQLDKYVAQGKRLESIDAYAYLIGFGLTHALEQRSKSLNLKRQETYLEGAKR